MQMTDSTIPRPEAYEEWKPEPVKLTGLFLWPIQLRETLKWLKNYLFSPISLFHFGIPLVTWFFLTPSMATMKTFALDWILILYFRNVVLLCLLNGAMHYWFYIRKAQGTRFKFNSNWPEKNNSAFLFRDQTKENMFWGIVSGCGFWTLYEAVTYWMFANGYMLFPVNWLESPIYCTLLFIAIPFIRAHHFYFTHRWTHWKPLYRIAHYLHHKYTNTAPWSGLSMHPLEHLIYFSGVALHWIIPSHPLHALFHAQHTGLAPVWGHSGFEKIVIGQKAYKFHDNFHFLHHRYFECNYGAPDTPFDHWFDTWHEGTEEATVAMKERLKQAATPKEA